MVASSSPVSLTFGIIYAQLQNQNLFWLCVSYHILYLCSGEEHLSGDPQEDHTRIDPKIWQLCSSLKRCEIKTPWSGRIKQQQQQTSYIKSITKCFCQQQNNGKRSIQTWNIQAPWQSCHGKKTKIANGSHLSARSIWNAGGRGRRSRELKMDKEMFFKSPCFVLQF